MYGDRQPRAMRRSFDVRIVELARDSPQRPATLANRCPPAQLLSRLLFLRRSSKKPRCKCQVIHNEITRETRPQLLAHLIFYASVNRPINY